LPPEDENPMSEEKPSSPAGCAIGYLYRVLWALRPEEAAPGMGPWRLLEKAKPLQTWLGFERR
jgi:hypothetical protein